MTHSMGWALRENHTERAGETECRCVVLRSREGAALCFVDIEGTLLGDVHFSLNWSWLCGVPGDKDFSHTPVCVLEQHSQP